MKSGPNEFQLQSTKSTAFFNGIKNLRNVTFQKKGEHTFFETEKNQYNCTVVGPYNKHLTK